MALKRKTRTLAEKCSALKDLETLSRKVVAVKYGIRKSTITLWLKNKERYLHALGAFPNHKRKRVRGGNFKQLDSLMYKWFTEQTGADGKSIRKKALEYSKELGVSDFQASNGWLDSWKRRHSLIEKEVNDAKKVTVKNESKPKQTKASTDKSASISFEISLPASLSKYKLDDIYTADEFGLLYDCLPSETNYSMTETDENGQPRITCLVAANATGDKLPMLVIGKVNDPQCFRDIKSFPCIYQSQPNGRMNKILFEEWVHKLDRKCKNEGRKIALVISTSPAHPMIDNLSNVKLIRLLPNTYSLKYNVVRYLKAYYRRRLVRQMIQRLDKNKGLPKISILQAMQLLAASWNDVSNNLISDCFEQSKVVEVDLVENPFKGLEKDLNELRGFGANLVHEDLTAEEYVNIDANVITADNLKIEDEAVNNVDGEVFDEPLEQPTSTEIEDAFKTLRNASLFCEEGDKIRLLAQHQEQLIKNIADSKTRCTMMEFQDL